MAQDLTSVSTSTCFIWKTERPFRDISRKSCDFSFLGAVWWLEAKYHFCGGHTPMDYTITLNKKTDEVSERNHINVTTILQYSDSCYSSIYNSGSIPAYKHQLPVQTCSEAIVWQYSQDIINSYCTDFLTNGAWEIICVFHNVLPTKLKMENIKVDSSTQIDDGVDNCRQDASTTAEKSTQVSRDFSDMEKLSEDLSNLFRSSSYPDAQLRCGDRTLSVHRSVLSVRSRVFDSMFRNASSSDTFDVTDLDGPTLDLLLEYAYSGTVRELTDDAAVGLYGAGRKYGMDSLRKACSDWMIDHLTPENSVSFLEAASDDGSLEGAVASFICEHPYVFKSSSWDRFEEEHQSLAYKIIKKYTLRNL